MNNPAVNLYSYIHELYSVKCIKINKFLQLLYSIEEKQQLPWDQVLYEYFQLGICSRNDIIAGWYLKIPDAIPTLLVLIYTLNVIPRVYIFQRALSFSYLLYSWFKHTEYLSFIRNRCVIYTLHSVEAVFLYNTYIFLLK